MCFLVKRFSDSERIPESIVYDVSIDVSGTFVASAWQARSFLVETCESVWKQDTIKRYEGHESIDEWACEFQFFVHFDIQLLADVAM